MASCVNKIMPGLIQVLPQLTQLHIWSLQCYHIQHHLVPCDLHLFPTLKEDLRAQNFSSHEEVKAAVCQWFWEKENYVFKDSIQKLVKRCQRCIKVCGD